MGYQTRRTSPPIGSNSGIAQDGGGTHGMRLGGLHPSDQTASILDMRCSSLLALNAECGRVLAAAVRRDED